MNIEDRLFDATNCERCGTELKGGRTMSWFTEETLCMVCSGKEKAIKQQLPKGVSYEGCGYVPEVTA